MEEKEFDKYKAPPYIQLYADNMSMINNLPSDQLAGMMRGVFDYYQRRVRLIEIWGNLSEAEREAALQESKKECSPAGEDAVFHAMYIGICEKTVDRSFASYHATQIKNSHSGNASAAARKEKQRIRAQRYNELKTGLEAAASKPCRAPSKPKEKKNPHGEYGKVLLTDSDYKSLISEIGEQQTRHYIERLDTYIKKYGFENKYKDHRATIRSWIRSDKEKGFTSTQSESAQRDYTAPDGF